jgi:hypothetical protein
MAQASQSDEDLNRQPQEPKMGSLLEPEVAPYGSKRHILWLRICTFAAISGARTAISMWQELSGVGISQCLGSERAPSRARSDHSESCLPQSQKFRPFVRSCILPSSSPSLEINAYLDLSQRPQAYNASIHPSYDIPTSSKRG